MVEAEQMHERRVQVVDVNAVVGGVDAELVGLAECQPRLEAAAAIHIVKVLGW
jgi:hypothetical protein